MPSRRQAPRIVSPSNTRTDCPSISSSIIRFGASSRSVTRTPSSLENPQAPDRGLDCARCRLAETADRGVTHALPHLGDHRQLALRTADRVAGDKARERLLLTHRPDATGNALAARLVTEERGDPHQQPWHVDGLVEHEHDTGA